jgi:signal transduction histidine kinase
MKANNPVKILLVDDLPENLFALELILADKNYFFVKANSGNEALKILLHEQDFAIILIDVQMPEMDGFETVELIREIEPLKDVPVIFLTASMDNAKHIFKGYQAGAVDYMIKPLIPEILTAKVVVFVELYLKTLELLVQNDEKEKRAAELIIANKELESFNYISSHDLQEPLRKIQIFSTLLIADEAYNLSDKGKEYVLKIEDAANRMRTLIDDLLTYSRTTISERKFETTSLTPIMEAVKNYFKEIINAKQAIIETDAMCDAHIIPFQFHQLMHNLIGNALKFSNPGRPPHIIIHSRNIKGSKVKDQRLLSEKEYCHITVTDNGIGFAPKYKDHIFEIFKRLHDKEKISGTGIGLTIAKKIVENHKGIIIATGELNKGASFDIYIPST